MTVIRFIGDTHGKVITMSRMMISAPDQISVHVGDVGFGWDNDKDQHEKLLLAYNRIPGCHKFIRGNHDSLHYIKHHFKDWWMRDGEYFPEFNMMTIGGGYTISPASYIEGRNWWADEEMNHYYMERVYDRYMEVNPSILVTHDLPSKVSQELYSLPDYRMVKNRTSNFFNILFERNAPRLWVAGHWHVKKVKNIGQTLFVVVPQDGYVDIRMANDGYELL